MKQYVVDAFTDKVFAGNPAAVCLPKAWPSEKLMTGIAKENRFSETAFVLPEDDAWRLRWFTPGGEIDLCGHATLATAYILMRFVRPDAERVDFRTLSGVLHVAKRRERGKDIFAMDFPAYKLRKVEVSDQMEQALGARPVEAWLGRDLLCIMDNESTVRDLQPDQALMRDLDGLLVNVTAQGEDFDCVSRSFAPKLEVAEDPVCGSGHCHILPYWSKKLSKTKLTAYQASERGGTIHAEITGDRVILGGEAALFSDAEILTDAE